MDTRIPEPLVETLVHIFGAAPPPPPSEETHRFYACFPEGHHMACIRSQENRTAIAIKKGVPTLLDPLLLSYKTGRPVVMKK